MVVLLLDVVWWISKAKVYAAARNVTQSGKAIPIDKFGAWWWGDGKLRKRQARLPHKRQDEWWL